MKLPISNTSTRLWMVIAVLGLTLGTQAEAQDRAGVVTTLEGHVTVARASLPQPAPLKFKDDIFVQDRIATSKDSVARILLGGRAVVTVREHSTVTITEMPGVATVDVAAGRVAVAVAREKMRAGEVVQVKTPNAVAGIRGTVIVAEVFADDHSVVTVLKGTIDVRRLEAGRLVGPVTIVNALERVTVAGQAPVSAPQHVTPAAARHLGQEFRLAPPRVTPSAATAAVNASEVARVTKDLARLPRRMGIDRGLQANDNDHDDITHDGRSAPGRDKWDSVGRLDTGPKGRAETTPLEAPPIVKTYSRPPDTVYTLPEATKSSEKSGRGNRGRERY